MPGVGCGIGAAADQRTRLKASVGAKIRRIQRHTEPHRVGIVAGRTPAAYAGMDSRRSRQTRTKTGRANGRNRRHTQQIAGRIGMAGFTGGRGGNMRCGRRADAGRHLDNCGHAIKRTGRHRCAMAIGAATANAAVAETRSTEMTAGGNRRGADARQCANVARFTTLRTHANVIAGRCHQRRNHGWHGVISGILAAMALGTVGCFRLCIGVYGADVWHYGIVCCDVATLAAGGCSKRNMVDGGLGCSKTSYRVARVTRQPLVGGRGMGCVRRCRLDLRILPRMTIGTGLGAHTRVGEYGILKMRSRGEMAGFAGRRGRQMAGGLHHR